MDCKNTQNTPVKSIFNLKMELKIGIFNATPPYKGGWLKT